MRRRFVLGPEQSAERLDKVLARLLPRWSRTTLQRWVSEGRVFVNGAPARTRQTVGAGAVVEVDPGAPLTSEVTPDPSVQFEVVYEDEHLIVIDKPPGLVVHPGRGNREGTLVAGLLARPGFEQAPTDPKDEEGSLRPGIVHRLDKDTSGVMVAAKDETTRESLKKQLFEHSVERMYRGITVGVPVAGRIEALHRRHPSSRLRYTSLTGEGRLAITRVMVDEVLAGGRAAAISCRLETGRTHQIRVHLSEQTRTPLLGDRLYGRPASDEAVQRIGEQLGRQALHAEVLGFVHPITRVPLRFVREPPADMQRALEALRALRFK